jgi:hypothetical protein
VSQEERSIFWEVTVSVILSKKMHMRMRPIPNGFRDTAMNVIALIMEHQNALRRATRHVLTSAAKCIGVEGGIFENL